VGSTVILPCWISPPENAEALEIRWYRHDQFNNPVLLYNHGKIQDIQECFRNRSSLALRSDQSGGLKDGDVSLRLEKLNVSGDREYGSKVVDLKITGESKTTIHYQWFEITIDRERSHPDLKLSEDCKILRDSPEHNYTDEGFPYQLCAFGAQRFTSGRHYWEVDLGTRKYTSQKLLVNWYGPHGFYTSTDPPVKLSLTPRPERLGVLFDYDDGQLSFYNITERKHLLTISSRFSGPVVPLFNPGAGDQSALEILDCPIFVESMLDISVLEVHCPAEFSSKLNETHLTSLTNVFKITRKSFLIIYLWVI
uniref:SPRY domain-containing protein n=1 Tax=Sinocyclocheilus anshuiensis TaxID=1608454 RepID=A0A671PHL7_9TELE